MVLLASCFSHGRYEPVKGNGNVSVNGNSNISCQERQAEGFDRIFLTGVRNAGTVYVSIFYNE